MVLPEDDLTYRSLFSEYTLTEATLKKQNKTLFHTAAGEDGPTHVAHVVQIFHRETGAGTASRQRSD